MSTSPKDVSEVIKELQEQVKNLKREVEQLKTEGDKTPPQKTESKVSNYVGVKWHKQGHKWRAQIRVGGKQNGLGLYHDEKEAARKYDEQASLHGRPVNFPQHEGMKQAVKSAYNRREKNNRKTSQEDIDASNSEADPEPKRQKTDG